MKRTLWPLLLLPACLLALWAWSVTKVTPEQIQSRPWKIDYCLPLPMMERNELDQILIRTVDAPATPREGEVAEIMPDLYAMLEAQGLKLDSPKDLTYKASLDMTITTEAPLPQHQILCASLITPPYSQPPPSGHPYMSFSPWREFWLKPKWLFGITISERIYWDISRDKLRPSRSTQVNYSALVHRSYHNFYFRNSWLEIDHQQTSFELPLWVLAFVLTALPTPLIYFLRRPLARLLPQRWRAVLNSNPDRTS